VDIATYLQAREFLQGLDLYLLILLVTLATVLAALSVAGSAHAGRVLIATVASLLLGFAVLVWFHYQIYTSVQIINPSNALVVGKLTAPLWIESEKLYFWAIFLGLFTYFVYRRAENKTFSCWLNVVFAGFVYLTMLTSNPFTEPLPGLHGEIMNYQMAMNSGDPATQMRFFQMFYGKVVYFYNSTYMWIHPPLLFISYAALIVSFLASVFMLIKRGETAFDNIAYRYARLGYTLLTFGMLVSYPWALKAWPNEPWWWSPKVNMSILMWMLYTAYLHSRLHLQRRGMWAVTASLGVLCFVALVLTYITTYLIPGVHSYG